MKTMYITNSLLIDSDGRLRNQTLGDRSRQISHTGRERANTNSIIRLITYCTGLESTAIVQHALIELEAWLFWYLSGTAAPGSDLTYLFEDCKEICKMESVGRWWLQNWRLRDEHISNKVAHNHYDITLKFRNKYDPIKAHAVSAELCEDHYKAYHKKAIFDTNTADFKVLEMGYAVAINKR